MAERTTIHAIPRTVLGKQVKQLRRQGILPANVFGKGLESIAIQLDSRDFGRTMKTGNVRSMFELKIEGESRARHVIVRGLSRKGGMGEPIHVDFYQVDLKRPIQTTVNLHTVNEAPAVHDLAGTLIHSLETVFVRCLPLSIPDAIEVDVSTLKSFDDTITVADLVAPEGVEILTDPSVAVATVAPPRLRLEGAEEEEAAEEAAEGEASAEEAEETAEA
ncbi:MAG TPA: 50S ribosomal protein L25 [Tepidiformaceae bacterium]